MTANEARKTAVDALREAYGIDAEPADEPRLVTNASRIASLRQRLAKVGQELDPDFEPWANQQPFDDYWSFIFIVSMPEDGDELRLIAIDVIKDTGESRITDLTSSPGAA